MRYAIICQRIALACLLTVLATVGPGCDRKDQVQVKLYQHVYGGNALLRLEIQGEITGPQDGLRYKWFSIAGECDPQESAAPTTKFQFADGSSRDRVTLEVWRGDRACLSLGELTLR